MERTEKARPDVVLSSATLRTSGALLGAQSALSRAIACHAVDPTGHDPTVLDLLVRLDQAEHHRLRGVQLSRQAHLSPSHVSRVIDRAEREGLVRRLPDPDDRRATLVELTDAGTAVLREFAPLLESVIERAVHAALSRKEADLLVSLLGRIEQAAAETTSVGP